MTPSLAPADVARAWESALKHARGATAPITAGPEEVARRVVTPLVAPVSVMLDALEQTAAAMRTQAQALDAAAQSFAQASSLLDVQASVLEHAVVTVRDPTAALRATLHHD